jgi:hypothetical protein
MVTKAVGDCDGVGVRDFGVSTSGVIWVVVGDEAWIDGVTGEQPVRRRENVRIRK